MYLLVCVCKMDGRTSAQKFETIDEAIAEAQRIVRDYGDTVMIAKVIETEIVLKIKEEV